MDVKRTDGPALRQWLVDYLILNIGCDPGEVNPDASMSDLGVGSRDSVVLSGELSELLGRVVSPIEFWQHPSINELVAYLTAPDTDPVDEPAQSETRKPYDEPIAVVGLGCRFPGGISGPDALWRFLLDGGNAVTQVPAERWQPFHDGSSATEAALAATTRWGAFLDDVDAFDAEFFDISPREASKMDPQQRLLLEVAWEALEHAGIAADSLGHSTTGVFVGACVSEYGFLSSTDLPNFDAWNNTGSALSIIANRLSYLLDLRGPSLAVDTACSSSLVALHLACQSLRLQESSAAIVAGVNLLLSPAVFHGFDQAGALSSSGMCHAFDAAADGFVRGEGCGAVILKRLSDAVADGNRVLALVRGSAVNQDGHSNGLMAPNPAAQMAVLRAAYRNAGIEPREVDYVEAHGTGTLLGDPIEARALGAVLGRGRPVQAPLMIGAVKSNLGHTEAAAGIAGFIKTVLALHHGMLPATIGYDTPNPHIQFEQMRLKVVAEQQEWRQPADRVRRAGVSSFGFGGTNAHVVLEQAPPVAEPQPRLPDPAVSTIVVAGKSPERIASTAGVLADWMEAVGDGVTLADVAHTTNHHRAQSSVFATVAAADRTQAVAGLRALAGGYPAVGVVAPHTGTCRPGTVFVYSGQGSQWAGMGGRLLVDEPAFAAAVDELEPVFVEQVGFSLLHVLRSGEPVVGIERIQPVLVGLQLALTELWRAHGVHPDAVIGHSMGEVTAAVVAGALTVADGLKVIATRSRLMSHLSGQGAMALLELDARAAEELITGYSNLTIAVYTSPRQTVIAGVPEQVDAAVAAVGARDRLARRIEVDVASHHPIIDPVLPELRRLLGDLAPSAATIPVFTTSGVQSDEVEGTARFDAEYWAANLRNPVRFSEAVAAAGVDHGTFVEVSPHPVLTHAIDDTLVEVHHHSIGTLARDTYDTLTFRTNVNSTHTVHAPATAHPPEPHPTVPITPWRHVRHWISLPERKADAAAPAAGGDADHSWFYELDWPALESFPTPAVTESLPWLVLADNEVGAGLARGLGPGSQALPASELDSARASTALRDAVGAAAHVLFAPRADESGFDAESALTVFTRARRLLSVIAAVPSPPRLTILTRNAQPMAEGDRANSAHATLWGMGRTLALEKPEIWRGVVDVDAAVPPELVAQYLRAEVVAADSEDQVVYRAGVRHVPRLRRRPAPIGVAGLPEGTSHLVIGATGNIGPDLIRRLAEMGADTVVAVSRRGGASSDDLVSLLGELGTTLVDVAADVADEAAMTDLLARFGTDLPPLDGIYLAALAGGAGDLVDLSDDDVRSMFRPKVDAAALLHRLTMTTPVRRFVLFSSITGLIGSRWLGHYAAAGAYLDTFAYARRALGLSATVVDWGLWKSWADAQPATAAAGLQPMPNDVAIAALPALLGPDAGVRPIVVAADWNRIAQTYRTRAALRMIDRLLDDSTGGGAATDHLADPKFGTLLGELDDETSSARVWRARLTPSAKPYPGGHRVQGVEVVPASVFVETLSVAARAVGVQALRDVRFEYPLIVDQPRVVRVTADDSTVGISSSTAASNTWVTHVTAGLADAGELDVESVSDTIELDARDFDPAAVAELRHRWGIEGVPFEWTVSSCRSDADVLTAEVALAEPSAAALLDAAVHIARLADSTDPRLLFPAAVAYARVAGDVTDEKATVEVRRRRGTRGGDLVIDVAAIAGDGSTCIDIRGLRYAAADPIGTETQAASGHPAPSAVRPDWARMSAADIVAELTTSVQAILARELGMPATAVGVDRPFPELGLDSMMAMTVLKEAKQLVGIDLSATMLWNHPTVSSMAQYLAECIDAQTYSRDEEGAEQVAQFEDMEDGVLDALFDSVESATAGNEGGL